MTAMAAKHKERAPAVLDATDKILALCNPRISREFEEANRTFTGSRLRCLFHRTWFMENQKRKRNMAYQATHPVFVSIQHQQERGNSSSFSRHSSVESMDLMGLELDPAGKTWERLMGSLLVTCDGVAKSAAVAVTAEETEAGVKAGAAEASAFGGDRPFAFEIRVPLIDSPLGSRLKCDKKPKQKTSSSIFELVAEQFEEHESPFLSAPHVSRRSSPSLTIALAIKEKELVAAAATATAAPSFEHFKEIQLRTAYTEIHNNTNYASDTASAFLGENLSVTKKGILQQLAEQQSGAAKLEDAILSTHISSSDSKGSTNEPLDGSAGSLPRSASLGDLLKAGIINASPTVAPSACLLRMPSLKSRRDVGDALGKIPNYSWILPYVVACAPPYIMNYLAALPCVFGYSSARSARADRSADRSRAPSPLPPSPVGSTTPFATHAMAKKQPTFVHRTSPPAAPSSSSGRSSFSSVGGPKPSRLDLYPSQASAAAPHWYSLGIVWACRNPAWQAWEKRALFVCHNYLFECLPDLQHGIIGYAQMSGSVIQRGTCTVLNPINAEPTSPSSSSHGNPCGPGSATHDPNPNPYPNLNPNPYPYPYPYPDLNPNPNPSQGDHRPNVRSEAQGIQLSVLTASKFDAPRAALWIRGILPEDLDMLEEILRSAQELTLEDVYQFPEGPEDEVILGRGRYNVVRKAVRRNLAKPFYSRSRSGSVPPVSHVINKTDSSASLLGFSMHSVESIDAASEDLNSDDMGIFKGSRSVKSDSSHSELGPIPVHMVLPDIGEDGADKCRLGLGLGLGLADKYSDDGQSELGAGEANLCALKLVSKEIFWKRVNLGKERCDSLVREILSQMLVCDSLQSLDPYRVADGEDGKERPYNRPLRSPVVDIYNVFETPDGFALDLELMEHIDLFDKLSSEGRFSEVAAQQVVLQLIDAVDMCNRLGIAHRDIKLSNITFPRKTFADAEEMEDLGLTAEQCMCVKLADFGMAGFEGRDKRLRGRCGTPGYVAPDILRAGMNESYDINVDVFSIGVVAYTLLCGYEPFYGGLGLGLGLGYMNRSTVD